MADFDLDSEIQKVAQSVDTLRRNGGGIKPETRGYTPTNMEIPPMLPQPKQLHYDFESLGEQIASGMVQAAEEQLMQAQNMLEQTKQFAADINNRIADKARELADMNNRLKVFGTSILEAHKRFHGEDVKS